MSDSIPLSLSLSLSQVIISSLFACKPNKSHLYNHPPLSLASDRTMNDLQAGLLHTCTFVWLHKRQTNSKLYQQNSYSVRSREVHGSDWVRLRGFFDPTHYGGSKKI